MDENLILANAAASRRAFNLVEVTGHSGSLSDHGSVLFQLMRDWYTRDETATEVNLVLLKEAVRQKLTAKGANLAYSIIDSFAGKASAENFAEVLLEARRGVLREAMIMELADKDDGDFYDLFRQFEELEDMAAPDTDSFVGVDPTALVAAVTSDKSIPLATAQLNACLRGGVLPASHTMIFGRPEVGKSLLAINCIAEAVRNAYRGGIWENEDNIEVTQLRTVMALLGCTEDEVKNMTPAMKKRLQQLGWYDRLFFHDSPGGTLHDVESWIKSNKLDVCVINQLANLAVRQQDNRTLELGALARGARAIGKETGCAIISVHQAGDSADGRRVLRMGDLEWSNTAIQAAIDVLIGFGVDDELEAKNQRMISLPKNKRGGTHDKVPVYIDLTRGTIS